MRILVIEDNEKLAASVKTGLEQEGYAVDVALDGEEGLLLIDSLKNGYDAVILDLMLPRKDGLSVCRAMRAHGEQAPVLMLTARDGVRDRVGGLDAGADDYLTKPFAFEELAARLRALLRRPRRRPDVVLSVGDVELDSNTHEVRVLGKTVVLTAKEFRLLELFLRLPRHVLSREQITNSLWDQEFDGGSNVVEVHIKNLRRKLEEAGKHDPIETVRGAGYRLKG